MSDSGDRALQDMEESSDGMARYGNMILEFIKKEVFQERKNITVDEVVVLVAALTDLSVTLLAKFHKTPIEDTEVAEIGRTVFKDMVVRLGFDKGQLAGKSSLYA